MKIRVNDNELRIDVTHVSPEVTLNELKANPFKMEAVKHLGTINDSGTVVKIMDGERTLSIGKAILAEPDKFCRHTGLTIALSRALKPLTFTKEERTQIWDQIFNYKYSKKD